MRVLPPYGETCTAVFLCAKGCRETRRPGFVLPFRPPVMGLVLSLAGQLVGGLAEPFNGFQFLPHGFSNLLSAAI